MTKDVGSFSIGFLGGLWYGKDSKKEIKKNEVLSENDFSDYEIIENTFKGPGSIDKVFEWHSKNNKY